MALSDDVVFDLTRRDIDHYPVGVMTLDRDGIILQYNRAEAALSGLLPEEVIGRRFFGEVAPCAKVHEFEGRFIAFAKLDDTAVERFAFTFRFAWGVQDVAITLMRRGGRAEIHVLVVTDTQADEEETELVRGSAARRYADSRRRGNDTDVPIAERVVDQATLDDLGFWRENPATGEIVLSERLSSMLAAPRRRALDRDALLRCVHPADRARVREALSDDDNTERPIALECRLVGFDQQLRYVLMHVGTHVSGDARFYGGTVIDTTSHVAERRRLRRAAEYDALTGLQNRIRLQRRLREAFRTDAPLAVLFLDLDGFKQVNDVAGHATGDRLLCAVAERIVQIVGRDGAARISGDEFAVVLTGQNAIAPDATARLLLDAIGEPHQIDGESFLVTASIGFVTRDDVHGDEDALLDAADDAMYTAKFGGKNAAARFTTSIRNGARERTTADSLVRRALTDDRVEVFFQPIVDASSRAIVACEALVRIRNLDGTLAMPADFIPRAETTGLIVPLGERIAERIVGVMQTWHGTPLATMRVSINVSPRQFADRGFLPIMKRLLRESGIAPDRIEVELTEGLMARFEATLNAIADLKMAGIRIAIDDFGTGYSALAYLKYFPIDTIKLDRAFVSGIGKHSLDEKIAATIVTLAKQLEFSVTAEGVESEMQHRSLLGLGVDLMQGYLFGRPVSAEEFLRLVTAEARLSAIG